MGAAAAGRGGVRERARARLRRDGRGSRRARGRKRSPVISPAVSGAVAWSREGKERGGPDERDRAVSGGSGRWQVGLGVGATGVRAVSGCDAGLLGARGADRWGRQLRRVARAERARLWSGRAGLAAQEGVGR